MAQLKQDQLVYFEFTNIFKNPSYTEGCINFDVVVLTPLLRSFNIRTPLNNVQLLFSCLLQWRSTQCKIPGWKKVQNEKCTFSRRDLTTTIITVVICICICLWNPDADVGWRGWCYFFVFVHPGAKCKWSSSFVFSFVFFINFCFSCFFLEEHFCSNKTLLGTSKKRVKILFLRILLFWSVFRGSMCCCGRTKYVIVAPYAWRWWRLSLLASESKSYQAKANKSSWQMLWWRLSLRVHWLLVDGCRMQFLLS